MNVEDYFMDPLEAKKLRLMAKQKGLQAVVDDEGIVKVAVSESAAQPVTRPPAARRDSSSSIAPHSSSTEGADAAAVTDPAADQQQQESSSSRSKLFSKSQLQPAAPGSGGMAPALPIVRPSSSRSEQDSNRGRLSDTPPWANKGRGRSGGSSYANDRYGSGSSSSSAGFFSSKSWEDLHATPELIAALKVVGVSKPSHIQAEAFKALSPKSGLRHVALADQAGSGKTLAYLLPLLQQLKKKEAAAGGPATQANSPSIVIMAPTTGELGLRVHACRTAAAHAGCQVCNHGVEV
jgi:hypothetical protein